ncbi:glycoside hydrolase superfamily [Gongronella butleri]|nr:glycoside hydrolase superfamily [Gongronella butleri]
MHLTSILVPCLTVLACATGLVQGAPVAKRGASKSLNGITFNGSDSNGKCMSYDATLKMVQRFNSNGVLNIRTYSQECDVLPNVVKAIEATNSKMTVMAAAWIAGTSADQGEIKSLINNVKAVSNKAIIHSVMVGNEAIFSNYASADTLIGYINQVKSALPGFKVGTVDTPNTFPSNLIDACDTIGVNIHPYFGSVNVDQAASNLQDQFNAFKGKVGGNKPIAVTETGWPTAGSDMGSAVPSVNNLASFVTQLTNDATFPYYFFETQDSNWKSAGSQGVENHWGILDASGNSKIPTLFK